MAFWSSEKLSLRIPQDRLIIPFDKKAIRRCAYELSMGSQATLTLPSAATGTERKITLRDREPLVIPPGQFALLLTKELVKVPADAIAFISIRAGKKFEGLVNVSGFHVDPGFLGRLKYSVYNAGSRDIVISEGDRVFMIWFADLDCTTADIYGEAPREQNEVSTDDLTRMQGEVASPAQLRREFSELQHSVGNWKIAVGFFITLVLALCGKSLFERPNSPSPLILPTVFTNASDQPRSASTQRSLP